MAKTVTGKPAIKAMSSCIAGWIVLLSFLFQPIIVNAIGELESVSEYSDPSGGQRYDTPIDYEEVTPESWRSLHLEMQKSDGSTATVDLLRPLWWLNTTQAEIGGSIYISLPELGLEGQAEVLSIRPCEVDSRTLNPGQRVVTGKFIHQNARVLDLHFNNESSEQLGVTSNHPIWSATQNDWVEAGHLKVGEYVRTDDGIAQLTMRSERPGRHQVYNLEVHRDHTYYVSNLGILAHNTYPTSKTKVVNTPEQRAPRPVKPENATDNWDDFLGDGPHTNVHPRTGAVDPDRLVSADGTRSIRYGAHEMGSKPTKHHYHEETWSYDSVSDTMTVDNTVVRVPLK